jgi:hypothetical protein
MLPGPARRGMASGVTLTSSFSTASSSSPAEVVVWVTRP